MTLKVKLAVGKGVMGTIVKTRSSIMIEAMAAAGRPAGPFPLGADHGLPSGAATRMARACGKG